VKAKRSVKPTAEGLMAAIEAYRERAREVGHTVERVIAVYEAGWSGFWLARWLALRDVEVHVVQPSSIPVDRRARRAKSDGIDAELLLRSLLAWLRGEPRVCSMVPVPAEFDEDARRCIRERAELVAERVSLVNRIGAVLATLGVSDFNPLLRNRRKRLEELRTGLGTAVPQHARAKIIRMIDRLELVLEQISELDRERDAVLEEKAPDKAALMIQELVKLRGIGVQSATVLVHEAFVREFANGKALGSYAGLTATPYSSGGTERVFFHGIGTPLRGDLHSIGTPRRWVHSGLPDDRRPRLECWLWRRSPRYAGLISRMASRSGRSAASCGYRGRSCGRSSARTRPNFIMSVHDSRFPG
jgi:transposase